MANVRIQMMIGASVLAAASSLMAGCESDVSAPNRAEMEKNLLKQDKARENVEKRELEAPKRDLPTGGKEFPGQTNASPKGGAEDDRPILLADAATGGTATTDAAVTPAASKRETVIQTQPAAPGPGGTTAPGTPVVVVQNVPAEAVQKSPAKPEARSKFAMPASGEEVPNAGGQRVEADWGSVAPLENYPHRPWAKSMITYESGAVKHTPIYFYDLDYNKEMGNKPYTRDNAEDVLIAAGNYPWFIVNGVMMPVLIFIHLPLQETITGNPTGGPTYHRHYAEGGRVEPAPKPGEIQWTYPPLTESEVNNATTTTQPAP